MVREKRGLKRGVAVYVSFIVLAYFRIRLFDGRTRVAPRTRGDIRHALRPESRVQRCGTLACALRGTAAPRTTLRASEGTHIFRSWHFFFFVLILRGETPERSHTTTSCASGVARPRSTRQAPCTTRAPTTSGARPLRSNRVLPLQKRIKKAHIPVSYR